MVVLLKKVLVFLVVLALVPASLSALTFESSFQLTGNVGLTINTSGGPVYLDFLGRGMFKVSNGIGVGFETGILMLQSYTTGYDFYTGSPITSTWITVPILAEVQFDLGVNSRNVKLLGLAGLGMYVQFGTGGSANFGMVFGPSVEVRLSKNLAFNGEFMLRPIFGSNSTLCLTFGAGLGFTL